MVRGEENPRFTEIVFQIRWKKLEGVEGKRREKEERGGRRRGKRGRSAGGAASPLVFFKLLELSLFCLFFLFTSALTIVCINVIGMLQLNAQTFK
jgi:hypothetical protein